MPLSGLNQPEGQSPLSASFLAVATRFLNLRSKLMISSVSVMHCFERISKAFVKSIVGMSHPALLSLYRYI